MLLMQSTVKGTSTRIAIQTALKRYYDDGNNTESNWARTRDDLQAVFQKAGAGFLTVQARIYPFNQTYDPLVTATALELSSLPLPKPGPDGKPATFGDKDYGIIPELYPNITIQRQSTVVDNHTVTGLYQGRIIDSTSYLLSGPYFINDTLSLVSITMPIINNTSSIDTMGWLTAIMDAHLIVDVVNSLEGLDDSGLTMLFGPNNDINKFPEGVIYNSPDPNPPDHELVQFVLPPTPRPGRDHRHDTYRAAQDAQPFDWTRFPAVQRGFTTRTGEVNNAGSIISSRNEENENVAVGYAVINSGMVDWILVVEQQHTEVWAPIYRLRNIILACVFGTVGAMLLVAYPVAHYSSRPIRRRFIAAVIE
jgi:osomolarity two-component system sensor histidine kinase SLN1